MTYFDYKVVPAPRRTKRVKGVSAPEELFALTLTEVINEQAHQGWEYVRAESMTAEAPRGWLRRGHEAEQTVLVFRRERETLGPRLATVEPKAEAPERRIERAEATMTRREPRMDGLDTAATPPTPLRPTPRLGPAERN